VLDMQKLLTTDERAAAAGADLAAAPGETAAEGAFALAPGEPGLAGVGEVRPLRQA
jgi:hypothetical protein